jgi:hypothetical protein
MVVLVFSVALFRQMRTIEKPFASGAPREASYVVHSRALPEGFVIRTEPKSLTVVATVRTGVELLKTERALERIDDEMLLQLAPGAVLVRYQTGPAELVFPNDATSGLESSAGHE